MPVLVCTVPQFPLPMLVVKFSLPGFGLKPQQAGRVVVVVEDVVVVVGGRVVVLVEDVVVVVAGDVVVVVGGVVVEVEDVLVVVATVADVVVVAGAAHSVEASQVPPVPQVQLPALHSAMMVLKHTDNALPFNPVARACVEQAL